MRSSCFDCVMKHLGSASVYQMEIESGYKFFYIYFVGELYHAEMESMRESPMLAEVIRDHRKMCEIDINHQIPYEEFCEFVLYLRDLFKDGVAVKDITPPPPLYPDKNAYDVLSEHDKVAEINGVDKLPGGLSQKAFGELWGHLCENEKEVEDERKSRDERQ